MSLGKRISERRKALGLTQQQLADRIGVSQSAVATIESRGYKKSGHTEQIAKVLHVSYEWLATGTDDIGETTVKHGGTTRTLADEHYMLIALFNNVSEANQEMAIRFLSDNQLIARPKIKELLAGIEESENDS